MAGLVSVTASCHTIELHFACLVGLIGAFVYTVIQKQLERNEVDDPLHSSSIHGFCGIWSVIALGLFDPTQGSLYTGNTYYLGVQMLGAAVYSLYAALLSFMFFASLKENDRLRVEPFYEIMGASWRNLSNEYKADPKMFSKYLEQMMNNRAKGDMET